MSGSLRLRLLDVEHASIYLPALKGMGLAGGGGGERSGRGGGGGGRVVCVCVGGEDGERGMEAGKEGESCSC